MKTIKNTLHYNKYAGELKDIIRARIEKAKKEGRDLLIVADTSAGKTTLATDLIRLLKRWETLCFSCTTSINR
tara:strand:- start:729 stop:947 length:219 start_codon:yes stop_codon:yes gene_type:complete